MSAIKTTAIDRCPAAAAVVGALGLLPFVGCAVQIVTGWPLGPRLTGPALYLLTTYAGLILAFVGGAQWGLAVADGAQVSAWRRYGASVVSSLVAWLGLWIGLRTGLLILAAGFGGQLGYDWWTVARGETAHWYGQLRAGLTVVAVACLLAAAFLGPL